MKQDELGRLLRRMVPPVDETGVWESIEQRTGCEQTNAVSPGLASDEPHFAGNARPIRPRRIHTRRRLIGLAAVTAIVLVAVGFGINALIEQLGQRDSVIVFTDGSMSPGGTGQGSLDPAGAQGTTLTGAKAELWAEIQRIREGVNSGKLSFGWNASEAAGGDLPSDPMLMLDSLEESLLGPDVTVYYLGGDSAGDASALQTEVSAMPGVARFEFVSKDDALERLKNDFADNPEILEGLQENPLPASLEVWLTDYTQAPSLADELRGRPEVDEVVLAPTMDYAQWVERLRSLASPLGPDVTVYLRDSAGDATALRGEISAMTGVTRLEFVSKDDALETLRDDFADKPEILEGLQGNPLPASLEIWLSDHTRAASLADELRSRPEVDEVLAPSATETGSGPTTTYGVATVDRRPASATTTIMGVGPVLSWGEEAVLDGRTIKVEQPVEVPERTEELPTHLPQPGTPSGSILLYIAYSLVTITNTGSEPLSCAAAEFYLDGNNSSGSSGSGSSGIGSKEKTMAGHEVLDLVTLQPGESTTRTVLFQLKQGDHPAKVLLGKRLPNGSVYSSTSQWLACWQ